MLSIRGRIILRVIEKVYNINPCINKNQIQRLRRMGGPDHYKAPKGWTREKIVLGEDTGIEFVKPPAASQTLVYVLHGGAYIVGMTDRYRRLSKIFSEAAGGGTVAFLDYRVAPKYIFPAALDDALAGWDKLLSLGYKPSNIVVVGDSAGGNLTLALLLKLRDLGKELPKGAVCMSPWCDMTASGESYLNNFGVDPMFGGNTRVATEMAKELLQSEIYTFCKGLDRTNPYISPVFGEYEGFPPMMFTVGSTEILLSDTLTIVDKLKKAGNEPKLIIGEKMFHVWPIFYDLFPEAKKAMKEILNFIKHVYQI